MHQNMCTQGVQTMLPYFLREQVKEPPPPILGHADMLGSAWLASLSKWQHWGMG